MKRPGAWADEHQIRGHALLASCDALKAIADAAKEQG